MKSKASIFLSTATALALLLGGIPFSALESAPTSAKAGALQTVSATAADDYQVQRVFTSKEAWEDTLVQNNARHQAADLSEDRIQAVLQDTGTAGLNKYQYYKLLQKEAIGEIAQDQLLLTFLNDQPQFADPALADLFSSITPCGDLCYLGKLKRVYEKQELLNLIGTLVEDKNVTLVDLDQTIEMAHYNTAFNYEETRCSALEQINAPRAWDFANGDGVYIGMIDTGVAGYSSAKKSSDTIDDCTNITSCIGHGTGVASVMAGSDYGLAYNATIVCNSNSGTEVPIANGMDIHRVNLSNIVTGVTQLMSDSSRTIKIVNISAEVLSFNSSLFTMLLGMYPNVLFVQAAGNSGFNLDNSDYFTYYDQPNFMVVASVDRWDNLGAGSNYGSTRVHIAAPGENIRVPVINGDVYYLSGTSYAAPYVSGAAALLLHVAPSLTGPQLKQILLDAAQQVPGLSGSVQSGRRLDVGAAVTSLNPYMSNRYAFKDAYNVLRIKENGLGTAWSQLSSNVNTFAMDEARVVFLNNDGCLYTRGGPVDTAGTLPIDTSGTVSSFAMSGQNLVTYSGTNLNIYFYDYISGYYFYQRTLYGINKYALIANRLLYTTTASPGLLYVQESFRSYKSGSLYIPTPKQISIGSTVTAIFVTGSRVHVYYGTNGYEMYDSTGFNLNYSTGIPYPCTPAVLDREIYQSGFSYNVSMNQYRWCYASGTKLYFYGFNQYGVQTNVTIINSANGQPIDSVKLVDYRIYYKAGSDFYVINGDPGSDTITLYNSVSNFSVYGNGIGIITGNLYLAKRGPTYAAWTTLWDQPVVQQIKVMI